MRRWLELVSFVAFIAVWAAAGLVPALAADDSALEVTLSVSPAELRTGGVVRADVVVANPGTGTATAVQFEVSSPRATAFSAAGCKDFDGTTCVLDDIASGTERLVQLKALVTDYGEVELVLSALSSQHEASASESADATGRTCTVAGSLTDDRLGGTKTADVICAGPGNDVIEGRGGADALLAGRGDDRIKAGWGRDRIDGGPGDDLVRFDRGATVRVDLTKGSALGPGFKSLLSIESVIGTNGDDTIVGSAHADDIDGGSGDDVLAGGGGPDSVFGGEGADELTGHATDELFGGDGIDTCLGVATKLRCERKWRPELLATVAGLEVYRPSVSVVGIGYHQSLFATAAAMTPQGTGYAVMSSRGRGTPSTSAADIVMPSGTKVRSPVSGRVVGITQYLLYCASENDVRILIQPKGRPDLKVMVLHVTDVRVHVGQKVVYDYTVLGTPRSFTTFTDQVDRYYPGGYPHVHVEVENPAASPLPGC